MTTLRLRENLGLRIDEEGCEIHGPRGFKILDIRHRDLLTRLFNEGLPLDEAAGLGAEGNALLKLLSERKVLRRHVSDYSRDEIWLSHYVNDARASLVSLAEKSVLIVGCGGTGALIADHLTRAGVRNFVLVDGARLDAPDLNRQWTYGKEDIGRPKVDILAEHLRTLGAARVQSIQKHLSESAHLAELNPFPADLIICAADKPRFVIENLLLDRADAEKVPILFGSVGITDDHVGRVLASKESLHAERGRLQREQAMGVKANVIQGSLCFTNTIAAAKIGFEAYRFLLGISLAQ